MKKIWIGLICLVAMAAGAVAGSYATDASGNWDNDTNWGGAEPVATEDTFIRSGTNNVYVTLDGEVANRLTLGQSGSQATLYVMSGSLELTGDGTVAPGQLYTSWGGLGETKGVVNLSGGSLTALGYGTNCDSAGDIAQLNISGGTFDLNGHMFVGGGHADADDSVNITGVDALIDISN